MTFSGSFFIDGAILIMGFKILDEFIRYQLRKRHKNNGSSAPGTAEICRKRGEEISELKEFKINTTKSLERIENKLDKLIERT